MLLKGVLVMDINSKDFGNQWKENLAKIKDGEDYMSLIVESSKEVAKREQNKHAAILETAENTKAMKTELQRTNELLSTETQERKDADSKNMRYTKRRDNLNFWLTIAGLIIGFVALVIASFK